MELNKVYELMSEFKKSGIGKMKLRDGEFSISLEMPQANINSSGSAQADTSANVVETNSSSVQNEETGEFIKSPIVGTFYEAPGSGMDPFVNIGQRVSKGQHVCIVEAMKMMNEISAPYDCIIEDIMVANESTVGYDQPLFKIRRS